MSQNLLLPRKLSPDLAWLLMQVNANDAQESLNSINASSSTFSACAVQQAGSTEQAEVDPKSALV